MKQTIIKYAIKLLVWLLDKMFDTLDSNDDGRISEEEAFAFVEKVDSYIKRFI